jgi:anaerobic magnesium-protoporphyrin IX monomethyl ester cyclase
MTTVALVYPYFQPSHDNSIFRFPPLGMGYLASYLKKRGISVDLVDCTFLSQREAVERVRRSKPKVIGIQSMFSMKSKALELARLLRENCELLVAGGPQPTSNPEDFLYDFDIVVLGEGEETLFELVNAVEDGKNVPKISGIAYRANRRGRIKLAPPRGFIQNLDSIPFPAREMFDNENYKNYYSRNYWYTTTSVMTSRGCPFKCDFCSRPVFGNDFRTRSAANIVDEMEEVLAFGYDRIWFADDCFTLNRKRLLSICDEITRRHVRIGWECLSRVDTIDKEVAQKMKQAGCVRMFYGIESGNDSILALMKKHATTRQAKDAVHIAKRARINVGAFFIVGYPGENEETVLDTVRFASSLPLDYLSFTMPYPIPGTPLYERVKDTLISEDWEEPKNLRLVKHKLLFCSPLSEAKLRFVIVKGMIQFYLKKYLGTQGYDLIGKPAEMLTDSAFKLLP